MVNLHQFLLQYHDALCFFFQDQKRVSVATQRSSLCLLRQLARQATRDAKLNPATITLISLLATSLWVIVQFHLKIAWLNDMTSKSIPKHDDHDVVRLDG